jgi:hypothetical protein
MNIPTASPDPAHLLRRLRDEAGARLPLALGRPHTDVDDGGDPLATWWLLPGAIVELSALPGAGALSVAFALAVRAREKAKAAGRSGWLCALDPSGTLSAPALLHLGVPLDELLVVRPPHDRLLPCATRACRSGMAAVVIDATAMGDLSRWSVSLRRLTLGAEQHGAAVLLVTSARARREGPLPCAARAEVDVAPPSSTSSSSSSSPLGSATPEVTRAATLVLRPVRHRHGLPPRVICTPSRSVIDTLLAEQDLH